ncbi:TetR/AcrR family transcriptional regulator [Streptomyces griseoloalbus]|uniref:AcrR family transcriptional regulator n=1 Tax=Streptomyces griseoloalbus TaxID=67303 RepID=A0A7W8BRH4_9ACTN|nr:TetR/AcrR family transcriptional regulator [Streptomyces albaduncus]MBB5128241.1 AcrR family transcriptional regulator [Streptomyces albaduncus]GGW54219.1 TetR family transcriptional regulator [Streptomyces albaduncus]
MTTKKTAAGTPGKATPRDRLLDAAGELFYREGVGIPTDALCKAAGVSKRSMYQLFDSKDAVFAAALERGAPALVAWLLPPPEGELGPRERLLYVFERLEQAARSPNYLGCPYAAAQVELKDPSHAASVVAARAKRQLVDFFRAEAQRAGVAEPDLLARQLAVVYDGASTRAGIGADDLRGLAVATAATLIDAARLAE